MVVVVQQSILLHATLYNENVILTNLIRDYDEVLYTCARSRRSEARIQQMLWKVNYSDIVFVHSVCVALLTASSFVMFLYVSLNHIEISDYIKF